ncbi:hypothetical protein BDV95DRAFT_589906 [Massariosphaeria phaeospora]|uniref:Uncharacterized protein n=1 Tax=Massariosphaeria phaeospora TaxID=100035 RepID=A0A7C8IEF6_9PLEO|nr:hypothetical protein BDV95DRAFT_589906 [Massariosphaeria phaeospora]
MPSVQLQLPQAENMPMSPSPHSQHTNRMSLTCWRLHIALSNQAMGKLVPSCMGVEQSLVSVVPVVVVVAPTIPAGIWPPREGSEGCAGVLGPETSHVSTRRCEPMNRARGTWIVEPSEPLVCTDSVRRAGFRRGGIVAKGSPLNRSAECRAGRDLCMSGGTARGVYLSHCKVVRAVRELAIAAGAIARSIPNPENARQSAARCMFLASSSRPDELAPECQPPRSADEVGRALRDACPGRRRRGARLPRELAPESASPREAPARSSGEPGKGNCVGRIFEPL